MDDTVEDEDVENEDVDEDVDAVDDLVPPLVLPLACVLLPLPDGVMKSESDRDSDKEDDADKDLRLGDDDSGAPGPDIDDEEEPGPDDDEPAPWSVNSESSVVDSPTDQSTSKTVDRYECRDWGRSVDLGRGSGTLVALEEPGGSKDDVDGEDDEVLLLIIKNGLLLEG